MSEDSLLGLLVVLSVLFLCSAVVVHARINRLTQLLLIAGLWLRVGGALLYLFLIGSYYGRGDYEVYYRGGLEYAQILSSGDTDAIIRPWMEGRWWGTSFVVRISGMLLSVIGPTLPGAFIAFAVAGYIGIVALWLAFARAFPQASGRRYLGWVVLFPSLWFWPAALGKDALVLCGAGLATLGFVGRHRWPNWPLMVLGVFVVFCIRPQVAAVFAFSIVAAHWLGPGRRWNLVRVAQGAALVVAGVAVLTLSSGSLGVELFDPQEVTEYLDSRANISARGGSALGAPGGRIAPWLAPVNTLFRPFPWEARGFTGLLAAVEVVLLWALAWHRRREIGAFVREYRRTRLFWLAVMFVLVYATALGMSIGNIGIIARQRVHVLPFVFMFFAGARRRRGSAVSLQPKPRDSTSPSGVPV